MNIYNKTIKILIWILAVLGTLPAFSQDKTVVVIPLEPESGIDGYQVLFKDTMYGFISSGGSISPVSPDCPKGKVPIGGGGASNNTQMGINRSHPDNKRWIIGMTHFGSTTIPSLTTTVYVICANSVN